MQTETMLQLLRHRMGPRGFAIYTNNPIANMIGITWGVQVTPHIYAVQGMVHADWDTEVSDVAKATLEQILIRQAEFPHLFQ